MSGGAPESTPSLRVGGVADAEAIARLHADSWRRHYRGAYSDDYLDGEVITERIQVWSSRLAAPEGTATVVAEDRDGLVGFVHVLLDHEDRWGSLVDNLHVRSARKRTGIGRRLLVAAGEAVTARAERARFHLWVLAQNTPAQGFYAAVGGVRGETAPVPAPGGEAARLAGSPSMIRFGWPDSAAVGRRDR